MPGSHELYSFDPYTGQHTLIGEYPIGPPPDVDPPEEEGPGMSGLALAPDNVPEPATLGLLAAGALALLRRRRRAA